MTVLKDRVYNETLDLQKFRPALTTGATIGIHEQACVGF